MKRNQITCWLWGMAALLMLLKLMAVLDPVMDPWVAWCAFSILMVGGLLAYRPRRANTPS
jgi:hypothetical protein